MKKLILLLIIFISCSSESDTPAVEIIESETTTIGVEMNDKTYTNEHPMTIDVSKKYTALIKTNLGDIEVEFFTTDAPKTVNNFITLSKDGYYGLQ